MLITGHLHEEKYLCKNFELKEAGGCLLEEGIFSRNLWVYEKTAINWPVWSLLTINIMHDSICRENVYLL